MSETREPDVDTRERDVVVTGETNMLVTFLIALFVIGPTIGIISLTLPHAEDANDLGILMVARRRVRDRGGDRCLAPAVPAVGVRGRALHSARF